MDIYGYSIFSMMKTVREINRFDFEIFKEKEIKIQGCHKMVMITLFFYIYLFLNPSYTIIQFYLEILISSVNRRYLLFLE